MYGRCLHNILVMMLLSAAVSADEPLYKTTYRVIDIHAHAPFPDERALKAHLAVLDQVGVRAFNVVLLEATGWTYLGGYSEANLLAWLELRKKHPERLLVFGTLDFNRASKEKSFFADIVTELEQAHARGLQGVKIWKNLGMHHQSNGKLLRVDDERLDPFWKACGRLGVPILIHTADPKEYWYPNGFNTFQYEGPSTAKYFQHPTVPPWEELIRQRNVVLKRHPQTKFIAAHFASLSSDFDELARALDEHPNLWVDCAARFRFLYRYHPKAVRDFFVKYQDRILFGTDVFLMNDPKLLDDEAGLQKWQDTRARFYSRHLEYLETDRVGLLEPHGTYKEWMRLPGVKLPPAVLEKIYHANAEALVPKIAR